MNEKPKLPLKLIYGKENTISEVLILKINIFNFLIFIKIRNK